MNPKLETNIDEILAGLKSAHAIVDRNELSMEFARRLRPDMQPVAAKEESERVIYRSGGSIGIADKSAADDAMGEENVRALAQLAGVKPFDGMESRVVRYWSSDERVDSYGDIVRQDWIFDRYKENPVAPLQHNWYGPPIGAAIKYEVRQRAESDYTGPSLWTAILFAPESVSALAESTFRLISAGFMRCISVGFRPGEVINVTDKDERAKLGLGPYGYVLRKNMLLEQSPVTIPANEGAHVIQDALKRGAIVPSDVAVAREAMRWNAAARRSRGLTDKIRRSIENGWRNADTAILRAAMTVMGFDPEPTISGGEIDRPIFDPKEFRRVDLRTSTQVAVGSPDIAANRESEKESDAGDASSDSESGTTSASLNAIAASIESLRSEVKSVSDRLDSFARASDAHGEALMAIADNVTSLCAAVADVRDTVELIGASSIAKEGDDGDQEEHVEGGTDEDPNPAESTDNANPKAATADGRESGAAMTATSDPTRKDGIGRGTDAHANGAENDATSVAARAAQVGSLFRRS